MEINLNKENLKKLNEYCEAFLDECFFNYIIDKNKLVNLYNIFLKIENNNIIIDLNSGINCDYNSFKKSFIDLIEITDIQEKLINEMNINDNMDISDLKEQLYNLKSKYLMYKKNIEIDRILDGYHKIDKVNGSKEFHNRVEVTTNKKLIYLDNNVINELENNENLFNEMLKLNEKFQIIYSSINVEEIARREKSNHIETINKLSVLTNNIGVFRTNDNKIKIFNENPIYSYNRIIEVGLDLNNAIENYRELVNFDNTVEDNNYNTQKHRDYINSNNNIIEDDECRDILSKALVKYGKNLSLEDYESMPISYFESYSNLNSSIYALMNALMFVGYKPDKNKKKNTIRSGVYDIEHLIFASKSNIFLTHDKKFSQRATIIFKILNINTEVIYFNTESIIDELNHYNKFYLF